MDEKIQQANELKNSLLQIHLDKFMDYGVFSYQWWILMAFLIIPWVLWIRFVDKKRLFEISFIGTLVIILTMILDWIGYNLNFWDYPIEIVPLIPGALPFDLSMVPVPYMLLYQYLKHWKAFFIGVVCMALIYAFIGEPFSNKVHLVFYIKWHYVYSFIYYILTGLLVRAIVEKLKGIAHR
jgi:hypothetical protein